MQDGGVPQPSSPEGKVHRASLTRAQHRAEAQRLPMAGGQELEGPNPFSSIERGKQKRKKRKWKKKEPERKPFQ